MTANLVDTFTTTPLDLAANDTLAVAAVGSIVTSDVAITWELGDAAIAPAGVVIANDGYIASTGDRAIESHGSLNGAQAIWLTNTGIITSADDTFKIGNTLTGGTVLIDNYGTMESTDGGQVFDFNDVEAALSIVINNYEGGLIRATDADAMRPGSGAVVNNHGHIISESDNDGIDFQDDAGGVVNNGATGIIEGGKHGITGDEAVTVFNDVGGTIIGHDGSAVNIDNTSGTVVITNYGTMEGRSAETGDSDGDAIDTDGLLALDNYGSIMGLGHEGYHDGDPNLSEGIATGGGTINNFAGGEIYGYGRAIQVDDSANGAALSATTIYNEGTIEGGGHDPEGVNPEDVAPFSPAGNEAINLVGDWADVITNSGIIIGGVMMDGGADTLTNSGTMSALRGSAVDMGAGDDQINLVTGSIVNGLIDGGADEDTIALGGTTTGELFDVANVETLMVEGGSWTLRATQTYSNGIAIAASATLTVGDGVTLGGDVEVDGLFVIENSGIALIGQAISGTGAVEIAGGSTTLQAANTYAGGTLLAGGTLVLAAASAAGSGDITFGDGAQMLVIGEEALNPVALSNATASFGNEIVDFGAGDSIDLADLAFAAGASADYDAATGLLTVSSYGVSYQLMLVDPEATAFSVESDGAGGTSIVFKNVGVTIDGNGEDNIVNASDTVFGQPLPTSADDTISGKGGDDRLAGLAGNDDIRGGKGDDRIDGGTGNDLIDGGQGRNKVKGGDGADAFLFDTALGDGKHAAANSTFSFTKIIDFTHGEDLVLLDQSIFSGLSLGPLSESEFARGKKAKDADDHILYQKSKGAVWFDADGKGGDDAVLFAKVAKGTDMHAGDFLVV
ncbi:MAG: hypothetical protein KDJ88_17365 [Bauldia sp.]|nr:hypothetical protein [Bauldia sp.]